jgi:multiple sugar transport system permease protein
MRPASYIHYRGYPKVSAGMILTHLTLIGWSAFTLFPILWAYMSSFKEPSDVFAVPPKFIFVPTLHNYLELFNLAVPTELENAGGAESAAIGATFPHYFLNSIVVSVGTTVFSLIIGSLAAYSLTRFDLPLRGSILVGMFMTRLIPPIAILIPLYLIWRNLNLVDTQIALIITYLSFTLPFTTWLMRGFLRDIPRDLEEAAMTDGCSRLGALRRIVLPLAAPGLATTAIFALIGAWNEFLFAVILTSDNAKTLSPAILEFITDKAILWGRLYAAGGLIMLPVLVFGLVMQRHLARGLTGGAVTG